MQASVVVGGRPQYPLGWSPHAGWGPRPRGGAHGPDRRLGDMEWVVVLVLVALVGIVVVSSRRTQERALQQRRAELEPVQKLAFEDVTALGTDLQELDGE